MNLIPKEPTINIYTFLTQISFSKWNLKVWVAFIIFIFLCLFFLSFLMSLIVQLIQIQKDNFDCMYLVIFTFSIITITIIILFVLDFEINLNKSFLKEFGDFVKWAKKEADLNEPQQTIEITQPPTNQELGNLQFTK